MVTILIAQQIAECLRKQEENVQLQGVWVFQSGSQWALEVECLRCLGILTPFVAVLDSCILCWEATPAFWNSHGSYKNCCLLQKLCIMRLAKSSYLGRVRPKHCEASMRTMSVGGVKVHTSVTDYFLQLPNFPSLPHHSSKCCLPPKGHGPIYIISTHDQNFGARVLCPLSSFKSAQLHVMQQHGDFQLLFCCLPRVKKIKGKMFIKLDHSYIKVNWKPEAGSVWDLTWSSV